MDGKMVTSIIGIIITVVLAVALFIPIVSDQIENVEKMDDTVYLNEPKSATYVGAAVKVGELSGTNEITWDGTTLSLNGSAIDLSYSAAKKPIIVGEQMFMTCQSGAWALTMTGILNDAETATNRTIQTTTAGLSTMQITFTGTDATVEYVVSDVTNTVVIDQDWGFIPSSTGKYVAFPHTAVSKLYYSDNLWAASNSNGHMISYSLKDGSVINGVDTTSVNTSVEIESTGIYEATIGANLADDSIQVNSTLGNPQRLFAYVVPDSVTYSSGENDSMAQLMSILPLLVIVALIISVIGVVVWRNE